MPWFWDGWGGEGDEQSENFLRNLARRIEIPKGLQ